MRVIEDGPVRSIVEAVVAFRDSRICTRYTLPATGTELGVELRVHWNEKDRMLKLSLPTRIPAARLLGQVAYGTVELPSNGDEAVAQKWAAVVSESDDLALTCTNDATYGLDFFRGELRLSLLRAPAHSGHPTGTGRPITWPGRHTPRIDQGEHLFNFWIDAGPAQERLARIDREALNKNEPPMVLPFSPSGRGKLPQSGLVLGDDVVQLGAFKQAEDGDDLIIRLFEPTGMSRETTVSLPCFDVETTVRLAAFEIKTLRFSPETRRFVEVNLLEEA